MDLVDTLRSKISALDDGDHISGLEATLGHIEVAFRHLARGQHENDETAFTDAIYRTNQAFEGGIKEAYRVLTGNDPMNKTPYAIEEYLDKNNVFRGRVLNQFKNYRTEWRNPSAHDYQLYFDESEAFLAIVSVSAFACLLADQIASKIAYNATKNAADSRLRESRREAENAGLFDRASAVIHNFASTHVGGEISGNVSEVALLGSLHGAISANMPDVNVMAEPKLSTKSSYRADLVLEKGDENVIVELKRFRRHQGIVAGRDQVERYLEVSGIKNGLLVFMPDDPEEIEILDYESERGGRHIKILIPKSAIKHQ